MNYPRKKSTRKGTRKSKPRVKFSRKLYGKTPIRNRRFGATQRYGVVAEPFPRKMFTRMKFATNYEFTTLSSTLAAAKTFRMNSIYDPDYAVGGNSCTGHSVMSSIYQFYLVTGAKVNVRFFDPGADGGIRVGCRLRIGGNVKGTAGDTLSGLVSQPLTYVKGITNTGSQTANFSFYVRPWTLRGISKLNYMANSAEFASEISNNPPKDCLMDVFFLSTRGDSVSISCIVNIEYDVQLYDRKELTPSA